MNGSNDTRSTLRFRLAVKENVMPQIISVHSYRGGTGKSNITANLATIIAARNRRVGVVDTDIQSPGIHILFSLNDSDCCQSGGTGWIG